MRTVVVAKWSACSLSSLKFQVGIRLKSTVFRKNETRWKRILFLSVMDSLNDEWAQLLSISVNIFKSNEKDSILSVKDSLNDERAQLLSISVNNFKSNETRWKRILFLSVKDSLITSTITIYFCEQFQFRQQGSTFLMITHTGGR